MLAPDRAQGHLSQGRVDGLGYALRIRFPAPFLALGSWQVVRLEKLLQGHFCGLFALLLPGFRLTFLLRLLPLLGQTLRPFRREIVADGLPLCRKKKDAQLWRVSRRLPERCPPLCPGLEVEENIF